MKKRGLQEENSASVQPENTAASAGSSTSNEELLAIVRQQQDQLQKLTELVHKTGNHNKIKEFERELRKFEGFAFSMKINPLAEGNKVVKEWKMLRDHVADEGRIVDQRVKITMYDGEEETIELVDFTRVLRKTDKILAKKLENLDGSEVAIDFLINPETKKQYPVMRPKASSFWVTLDFEGDEYRMLSTYLNA